MPGHTGKGEPTRSVRSCRPCAHPRMRRGLCMSGCACVGSVWDCRSAVHRRGTCRRVQTSADAHVGQAVWRPGDRKALFNIFGLNPPRREFPAPVPGRGGMIPQDLMHRNKRCCRNCTLSILRRRCERKSPQSWAARYCPVAAAAQRKSNPRTPHHKTLRTVRPSAAQLMFGPSAACEPTSDAKATRDSLSC